MHPHVLKDSLSLIRMLENMNLSPDQEIFLTSADIAALYPSINIEDGLEAMRWFMKEHTNIPDNLQKLYLDLFLKTTVLSVEVFSKDVSSCRK